MKIAVIVNRFPIISETFILNQILGAIERGYEVHIYPLNLIDSFVKKSKKE